MATAAKPYKAVLEKYYAETRTKWRGATEEEMAALREAARDPDNDISMTRFKEPPTVQQVIDALSRLPSDAKVLVSDHDGNRYTALLDISEARPLVDFRCDVDPPNIAPDALVVTLYPR
jgi:hypothetical protein